MKKRLDIIVLFAVVLLLLSEASLQFAGYLYSSKDKDSGAMSLNNKGTYRILCVGDTSVAQHYAGYLERLLNEKNIGIPFTVTDKRQSGATTDFVLATLEDDIAAYKPDMIVAMVGGHDTRDTVVYENTPFNMVLHSYKLYRLSHLIWYKIRSKTMHAIHTLREAPEAGFVQAVQARNDQKKSEPKADNDKKKKEKALQKGIKDNPHNKSLYTELAQFYNIEQRHPEAEMVCKEGLRIDPGQEWLYVQLSVSLNSQRKYEEAESAAKKAIEINPRNGWGYINLAEVYKNIGKQDAAASAYAQAVAVNPKHEDAYLSLADLYMGMGDAHKAKEVYKRLITHNPGAEKRYLDAGDERMQRHEFGNAEEIYKKALEISPNSKEANLALAALHYTVEDYQNAEMMYERVLRLDQKNSEAQYGLANLYKKIGKSSEAKKLYEKSLISDPKKVMYRIGLGELLIDQGRYQEAIQTGNTVLAMDPANVPGHLLLASVYQATGRYPEAEKTYKKAIALAPQNTEVYTALGRLYALQGHAEEAEEMFKRTLATEPHNVDALLGLMQLAEKKGAYAASAGYLDIITQTNKKILRGFYPTDFVSLLLPKNPIGMRVKRLTGTFDNPEVGTYTKVTIYNYRRLKAIIESESAQLVCVQYPGERLLYLKNILAPHETVLFVDNERTQAHAPGASGPGSPHEISMALANNVATVILQETFNTK